MPDELALVQDDVDYDDVVVHPLLDMLDQGNVVDEIPNADQVASDILDDYSEAYGSMNEWREQYELAIKLAKLKPKEKHKTFPFRGASTAMLPLVMDAMLDFNARSAPELAFSKKIVSVKTYGEKTEDKEARAERVAKYSNYQLSEQIPHWRDEQDKNLFALPCVGTTYKKTYYDPDQGEVCSDLCLADQIVFDQKYRSFDLAPDKYEKCSYTKNELICYIRGEQKWDIEEDKIDDEDDEEFIEAYTWIDMDGDGLEEPYFVVVWERNSQCVYARPLFDEDTITLNSDDEVVKVEMIDILTQYIFMPDPEGGPMGLGWGILLGPMFKQINTSFRQQLDAGTLMTTAANSGLINVNTTSGRGNATRSGPIEVKMGQLTPVPVSGAGNLSQNVVQFPFQGPNPTMFQLLQFLNESARAMINTSFNIEANANEAATLYLARLQQGLKRPNVIIMRVYGHAKKEFAAIFKLNSRHYSDKKYNRVLDEKKEWSMQADFKEDDCDIELVADPSQGSDMERAARSMAILEEAKMQPQAIINLRQAYVNWLESLQLPQEQIEVLAPEPDPNAVDPEMQMLMAERAMEAEFKQRDQQLREQGQKLQAAKLEMETQQQALEAAQRMSELGLKSDDLESQITERYSKALKNLADIGMSNPLSVLTQIENRFIDNAEGGRINEPREPTTPASNPRANPALGNQSSN